MPSVGTCLCAQPGLGHAGPTLVPECFLFDLLHAPELEEMLPI